MPSSAWSDEQGAARTHKADDEDQDATGEAGWVTGIQGTLYTVGKENTPHLASVVFRLLLDVVQLLLLIINPAYGFVIDSNNMAWKIFSFLQLNDFMTARGYTFFLACVYIMVVGLCLNVGLCIWVSKSFAHNTFSHVWPIVCLRVYSLVFFQVLDVASLTLFLMTMDCQYFSVPDEKQGMHAEFPTVSCFSMPHMIHVAVSAVAFVVFVILATAFTVAAIDLNPASMNRMGMAHTGVEGICFGLKAIMTCAQVFINSIRWVSFIQFVTSTYMFYLYVRWEPHIIDYMNKFRVASYAMVVYAATMLVVIAFPPSSVNQDDDDQVNAYETKVTIALWVGLAPAAGLGWMISHLRLRYFQVTVAKRFLNAPSDMKPKLIHKFTDPREVEIGMRVLRVWLDEDTLDPDAVELAEHIARGGKAQLASKPYMAILWSSFLIDVQKSYNSGYTALQAAKKAPSLSFLERFAIFVREQQHTQKMTAATAGDSENVDLVSYVEFQRNYGLVVRLTMEALLARKAFWQALEMHRLARFSKLAAAVARMDAGVHAAERTFRQVLSRHGNSVKILQLYVKFLQGVKNDPWAAARWSAEVEKLQRTEEEENTRAVMGTAAGLDKGDDYQGIVVIGANCLIRMVNDVCVNLFGYSSKTEMIGHNVNIIVPPPYSKNHNSYVRNYISTGAAEWKWVGAVAKVAM